MRCARVLVSYTVKLANRIGDFRQGRLGVAQLAFHRRGPWSKSHVDAWVRQAAELHATMKRRLIRSPQTSYIYGSSGGCPGKGLLECLSS
jgi:hypothetical protein